MAAVRSRAQARCWDEVRNAMVRRRCPAASDSALPWSLKHPEFVPVPQHIKPAAFAGSQPGTLRPLLDGGRRGAARYCPASTMSCITFVYSCANREVHHVFVDEESPGPTRAMPRPLLRTPPDGQAARGAARPPSSPRRNHPHPRPQARTRASPPRRTRVLCGADRLGHFTGLHHRCFRQVVARTIPDFSGHGEQAEQQAIFAQRLQHARTGGHQRQYHMERGICMVGTSPWRDIGPRSGRPPRRPC